MLHSAAAWSAVLVNESTKLFQFSTKNSRASTHFSSDLRIFSSSKFGCRLSLFHLPAIYGWQLNTDTQIFVVPKCRFRNVRRTERSGGDVFVVEPVFPLPCHGGRYFPSRAMMTLSVPCSRGVVGKSCRAKIPEITALA